MSIILWIKFVQKFSVGKKHSSSLEVKWSDIKPIHLQFNFIKEREKREIDFFQVKHNH